jgi:hypothetical protein
MADDLDDFFNDIEEAEAGAVKEDDDDDELAVEPTDAIKLEEPAAKRPKTVGAVAAASAPVRPKGLVVAAASSAVIRKPIPTSSNHNNNNEEDQRFHHSYSASNSSSTSFNNQPSLPVGPPPPPPPPPPLPPLPPGNAPNLNGMNHNDNKQPKKPVKRMAAGKVWVDATLDEWPENDFRIFCGNLDASVTDAQLHDHFATKYASLAKVKVVKDGAGQPKGFGFVSFLQPLDCAKAIREMDQTWLGSRPIRVKRSDWQDRNLNQVRKKNKKEWKKQKRLGM